MHDAGGAFSSAVLTVCVAIRDSLLCSPGPKSPACSYMVLRRKTPKCSRLRLILILLLRSLVVDLHAGAVAQRAQNLIAAGYDFVPFFETVGYFDVGGAGNACLDRLEFSLSVMKNEDSLNLFFRFCLVFRVGRTCRLHSALILALSLLVFEIAALTNRKRLNRDRDGILASSGGDLSGRTQTGTQVLGRILESDDDLKIFCFLAAAESLSGRDTRGAQDGVVPDLSH